MYVKGSRGGRLRFKKFTRRERELGDHVSAEHVGPLQTLRLDQSKAAEATPYIGRGLSWAVNDATRDVLCSRMKLKYAYSLPTELSCDTQAVSPLLLDVCML